MPFIGVFGSVSPAPYAGFVAAIKEGLQQTGYVEGRNFAIEYRWADGQYDRLPQLATELVDRGVAVIVLVLNASAVSTTTSSKKMPCIIPFVQAGLPFHRRFTEGLPSEGLAMTESRPLQ